jgi:hypothetical protein
VKIVSDLAMEELPVVWAFTNVDIDVLTGGELFVTEHGGKPLVMFAGGTWRMEFLTSAEEIFAGHHEEATQ